MNAALDTAEVKVPEYGVYDVDAIRADFPALSLEINGYPIAFLDSGASAQKPDVVIERMNQAYRGEYANVHRGAYSLSQKATDNYEEARTKNAALAGKVLVRFSIAQDGSVSRTAIRSTSLWDTPTEDCVSARVAEARFPALEGGRVAIVTYPFVFPAG